MERAGFISDAFIGGSSERTLTTELEGEAVSARLQYRSDEVSEGLFQAFGTRLRGGRFFSPRDGPASPRVAIVNDALARHLWPGGDAVGRHRSAALRVASRRSSRCSTTPLPSKASTTTDSSGDGSPAAAQRA